jgi:hypothetical protein
MLWSLEVSVQYNGWKEAKFTFLTFSERQMSSLRMFFGIEHFSALVDKTSVFLYGTWLFTAVWSAVVTAALCRFTEVSPCFLFIRPPNAARAHAGHTMLSRVWPWCVVRSAASPSSRTACAPTADTSTRGSRWSYPKLRNRHISRREPPRFFGLDPGGGNFLEANDAHRHRRNGRRSRSSEDS